MPRQSAGGDRNSTRAGPDLSGHIAAQLRPTEAQRRYLERGLTEPGGKLPLFDRQGREVPKKTIESYLAHGWAKPWLEKPDQARLAGLPADRGGLSGARGRATGGCHPPARSA